MECRLKNGLLTLTFWLSVPGQGLQIQGLEVTFRNWGTTYMPQLEMTHEPVLFAQGHRGILVRIIPVFVGLS